MTKIRLVAPPPIQRALISEAKARFPREMFAYLLGNIAGDLITIDDIWTPEDLEKYADDTSVEPPPDWLLDAQEQAHDDGLMVVGWAHSHPYRYAEGWTAKDHSQSENDLDCGILLPVSAVVLVQDVGKIKRRLRASVRFWGPLTRLEVLPE